ncbi:AlkA N-terminal domain-containing protein [Streptomyces sp. 4N509B]|uniref:AlkA N-terminal domain-containing protein n=1 Tax=Streptomyces sp. 4N509B TaxID=3457413 RepID=UPI003FD054CC
MDDDSRYEAVRSRDERFDGVFFVAVLSTGIYCRPSCPAMTPKRENVRFHPSAAAAQSAGFRACRRCRPDTVPGSAEWNARADSVGRAMRLIGDGVVDREGVAGLADRLGYSARHVHRQLTAEVGAGPVALARAQRAHTARLLLQTTALPVTEVAFAAGFASIRQFNDTVRAVYDRTPSELRAATGRPRAANGTSGQGRAGGAGGADDGGAPAGLIELRLAHRGPYDARQVFDFLGLRAIPGVEEMRGEPGARLYRRTLALPHGSGVVEVGEAPPGAGRRHPASRWLPCRLRLTDPRDLTTAVQRTRRLFDLDADPYAVAERLGEDPTLAPLVAAHPGLRSPGAAQPEELAVRAVLGQQVTVAAARTLAARIVAAHGSPLPAPDGGLTHLFPDVTALARADLTGLGMPAARGRTVTTLCAALRDGVVRLDPGADREEVERALLSLPGIGPWTAGYVRMRALGDPDVFLPGDAGIRHGLRRLDAVADAASTEAWRPWRSYAVHLLWLATALDAPAGPAVPTVPAVPAIPTVRTAPTPSAHLTTETR